MLLRVKTTSIAIPPLLMVLISVTLFVLLSPCILLAEGSKELTANGGNRAYLLSSTVGNQSFPFATLGTMKVYVKAGETIYAGSSAQGIGTGTINLRSPDGLTYSSGSSANVGKITDRNQELAGPLPNAGGYTPYAITVAANQAGVWEIDFISPVGSTNQGGNPTPVAAQAAWTQPSATYVSAFDVTVRNAANTAFIPGRVFTNIFAGILGSFDVGFNGLLYILTKDGYQYSLNNNGQAGNGFSFFANNKGFRNANGAALYQSLNSTTNPNIQDPTAPDTQTDITHKIFFNAPAADLPATAGTPGGLSTWLLNAPFVPVVNAANFTGTEGTIGVGGTAPLGGNFNFNAGANGTYTITIDVNQNGIYTDAMDRQLTGTVISGNNAIAWDGLDGLGKKVPASLSSYNATIGTVLFSAEVHFPFFDVERNTNGIILKRLNGINNPDYTVYWDDSQVASIGTPSNPVKNTAGISSLTNGHKWGTTTTDPVNETDFGNNKSLDTYTYVIGAPILTAVSFKLQEADLQVSNITVNSGCVGQQVKYTVDVTNAGPSAVTGATFSFAFPAVISGISVSSVSVTDTSAVNSAVTATALYTTKIDMTSGAVRRFTISGTVSALPAGGALNATAAILRPADVTDPDATNPDAAPPTNAQTECDAAPSGVGCNNVKIISVSFSASPNAGIDQTVIQGATVTLTANTTGVWSQAAGNPTNAIITNTTSITTTVTGLNNIGKYNFVYTNANGCADTVAVNVLTSAITINTIFTPNGDGKNDTFEIQGITNYPGSQLLVFNRWGNEVYRSDSYANTWEGSGLAEGTYYYLLNRRNLDNTTTAYKGFIYLKR